MNRLRQAAAGAALATGLGSLAYPLFFRRGQTRLISRNRIAAPGTLPGRLFSMLVMEPGSLIMERKMLLGIKQRAEDLGHDDLGRSDPAG